jgi:gamma-tubulin complex component 2
LFSFPWPDKLLQKKVKDFLSMIRNIWVIQQYDSVVSDRSKPRGRVACSVANCMRSFAYDFRLFVTRLDDRRYNQDEREMNLSALWSAFQGARHSLELLADIAAQILTRNLRGGQILSLVWQSKFIQAADERSKSLLLAVQKAAFEPFLAMLESWIYRGVVDDPFDEFMIYVTPSMRNAKTDLGPRGLDLGYLLDEPFSAINRDHASPNHDEFAEGSTPRLPGTVPAYFSEDFWTKAYSLHDHLVPHFLSGSPARQIVDAGKYVNAIKKCGECFHCPYEGGLKFTGSEGALIDAIAKAHAYASHRLVKFLIDQHRLLDVLGAVKHHFLMDQADFMEEFLILCDSELGGCIGDANINRLNTLLELALRTSIGANEPYKDDIKGDDQESNANNYFNVSFR